MSNNAVNESWLVRAGFAVAMLAGVRPSRDEGFVEPAPISASTSARPSIFASVAAQDVLVVVYLVVLLGQAVLGEGVRTRSTAIRCLTLDLAGWLGVLLLVRSQLLAKHRALAGALYRVGIGFPVLGSFLQLQYILPAAGHPALDGQLYHLDLAVFGVEPALAWDRFVSPATTEWFAFFYYGYFGIIAIHVLPMLFFAKSQHLLARFSFGFLWLYCVGQALYTFVPAFGPYAYLAHELHHPLSGSFWWPLVRSAVDSVDGGARTDVFPSLHTALPTYCSLFSFFERRRMPFKLTWLPLALFTTQIIGATMFLRWHYLVDVCAGLLLAVTGIVVSRWASRWDESRQRRGGARVYP